MIVWNTFIDLQPAPHPQQLLEKSVIVAVLIQNVGKYGFDGSPLSSYFHSQQLALIGSQLMQQNLQNKKPQQLINILEQSNKIYKQQELQAPLQIEKLKERYPESSRLERSVLIDQAYLCKNMTNKQLPNALQLQILTTAKEFAVLKEQGKIDRAINTMISDQKLNSNLETTMTVNKMLEFKFMEQDRIYKIEQKSHVGQLDHNKQLTPDNMLMKAINETKELQNSIIRQQLLEPQAKQQQQLILNKNKELER